MRLITLPNKTLEGGEDVLGIEITENVTANDGKPAFLNMGVHHAREWPAGELTMEWAYELINGYKAGDARATNIVRNSRNLVVPIVNPDGFNGSRNTPRRAAPTASDETVDDTAYIAAPPGEYRRKNCRVGDTETASCPVSVGLAENGVDPNRNYGQFWGGPGSDTNPATQTYRGPAPFSEPESRNIQWLVSHNQVTSLITNHTTAGLVLRAPGLAAVGDPVDENRGYKALGDDMAKHNGYFSQKGFELYDTTGTTEDWSYNATGGFGFTFEIYCGAPELRDRRLRRARVPPALRDDGQGVGRHERAGRPRQRPGRRPRLRRQGQPRGVLPRRREHDQRGAPLDPRGHRAGRHALRLTKDFKTETFPQNGTPLQVDDHLETVYDVGASGAFRWHVNPSTRPLVAKEIRRRRTPARRARRRPAPRDVDRRAIRAATPNDEPVTTTTTRSPCPRGDNASAAFRVEWATPVSDWDVKLYEDTNGNGARRTPASRVVGTSAQGTTDFEEVTDRRTRRGQDVRAARDQLRGGRELHGDGHLRRRRRRSRPAQIESYTLTCERDGAVLAAQQVVVERGADGAGRPVPGAPGGAATPPRRRRRRAGGGRPRRRRARPRSGLHARSASSRSGSGVRIELVPRRAAPGHGLASSSSPAGGGSPASSSSRASRQAHDGVQVERQGARRVTDGYYFVRFTLGKDTRRITLRRARREVHAGRRLLPPRELRPGAELQAHAAGVRRHVDRSARDLLPDRAQARQVTVTVLRGSQDRQALRGADGRPRTGRCGSACRRRGSRAATTRCG